MAKALVTGYGRGSALSNGDFEITVEYQVYDSGVNGGLTQFSTAIYTAPATTLGLVVSTLRTNAIAAVISDASTMGYTLGVLDVVLLA